MRSRSRVRLLPLPSRFRAVAAARGSTAPVGGYAALLRVHSLSVYPPEVLPESGQTGLAGIGLVLSSHHRATGVGPLRPRTHAHRRPAWPSFRRASASAAPRRRRTSDPTASPSPREGRV